MKTIDTETASALIGLVYDAAFEKHQWSSLTTRLIELCPGHVSAVVTFEDARWVSSHVPTLDDVDQSEDIAALMEDVEAEEVEQPNDLNDLLFKRQPLELGTLYSTRQIFSEDEFRNFEGYKQTMKPIGAGHWTGAHYSISGGRRAAIMVVENDFDPTPKDHENVAALITLITPHMIRAAQLARTLTLAREAAETYAGFVDAIALPLVVMTRDGQLQVANALGQRLLDAGEVIGQSGAGQLLLGSSDKTALLTKAIRAAEADGGPHAFQVDAGDAQIAMCVCPYRPALSFESPVDQRIFAGQNLFAVLIGARPTGAISAQLLRDAYGLTQREADVCRGLLAGQTPQQLAHEMGKSEKTIRNQVHAVHEKVGVKSTRDLADVLSVFRAVGAMYAEPG